MKYYNKLIRVSTLIALLPLVFLTGCNDSGVTGNDDVDGTTNEDSELQAIDPVPLGDYCDYVILAKSGISTVPNSDINGDIGVSPAAQTSITGFALTDGDGFATSDQVNGFVYAADQEEPTPSNLTVAINEMEALYTNVANRPNPVETERNNGELGGDELISGVYKWSTVVTASSDFTLSGDEDDVWIFQIEDNLTVSSDVTLILNGGAKASNVFWQVAGAVTIGTNAHFEGIILSKTAINLQTGASHIGKLLAQTAVTLDQNSITDSGCSEPSDDDGGDGDGDGDGDDGDGDGDGDGDDDGDGDGDDDGDGAIGDFGLLTPVNDCQSVLSCPDSVVFEWEAATSELPVTYYLHIDVLDGDFSAPLVTVISDEGGSKTTFTVDIAYINQFLIDQGVDPGVEVSYIWTVSVHTSDDVFKFSEDVFILNMIRCDS